MKRFIILLCVVAVVGLLSATVQASISIPYTVAGLGPTSYPGPVTPPSGAPHSLDGWGYPGDTVELQAYTGFLNLTPGTYTLKINTLLWGVDYTYNGTETAWDHPTNWPDITNTIYANRSITIGAATGSISQNGTLKNTWFDDYLSFAIGATTTLYVTDSGSLYQVDITAKSLPVAAVNDFNGYIDPPAGGFPQTPRDMMADFVVTYVGSAVPEPATLIVWSLLGAASWLGMRVVRRGRHVGRQPWSDENRQAIHAIIARGGRN